MYRAAAIVCCAGLLSVGGAVALVMAQSGAFVRAPAPTLAVTPDMGKAPRNIVGDTAVKRVSRPVIGPRDLARSSAPSPQTSVEPARDEALQSQQEAKPNIATPDAVAISPFSNLADIVQPTDLAPQRPLALRDNAQTSPLVADTWQIGVFR